MPLCTGAHFGREQDRPASYISVSLGPTLDLTAECSLENPALASHCCQQHFIVDECHRPRSSFGLQAQFNELKYEQDFCQHIQYRALIAARSHHLSETKGSYKTDDFL